MPIKQGGVYQIVNMVDGKQYVGSTVNLRRRWGRHCSELRSGKHCNRHLQNAWNLHGGKAFTCGILEYIADHERLIEREQQHLDFLNPEYNLSPTAGSCLGTKHTGKTRLRISEANKALWADQEYRQKQNEAVRAAWAAPERRQKVGEANRARWTDPGYRQKQNEAVRAACSTPEAWQEQSKRSKAAWANPEYRRKMQGGNSPNAKLSEQDVKEIKVLLTEGALLQREIAARYGVSRITISDIKRGRTWAHLSVEAANSEGEGEGHV